MYMGKPYIMTINSAGQQVLTPIQQQQVQRVTQPSIEGVRIIQQQSQQQQQQIQDILGKFLISPVFFLAKSLSLISRILPPRSLFVLTLQLSPFENAKCRGFIVTSSRFWFMLGKQV